MSGAGKRKHKTLSIHDKVQLLKQLDEGVSVKRLCKMFCVGSSTIYDLKKKKEELLKFYAERQSKKGVAVRRTMKEGKCSDLERALVQWFESRQNEGVTVTGGMLVEQAKVLHKELKLNFECKYSHGWLDKFKNRHGIRLYSLNEERSAAGSESPEIFEFARSGNEITGDEVMASTDCGAAEEFFKVFTDFVSKEELHPEQVYIACPFVLHWNRMPKKMTITNKDNKFNSELQYPSQFLTIYTSFNATITHKCKLLVCGDSLHLKALSRIKVLPAVYKTSKQNSFNMEIIMDWFENYFVNEARRHCISIGLDPNCKILLILNTSILLPPEKSLEKDNVHAIFCPPNCESKIYPPEYGTLRALKCWYRLECLNFLSSALIQGKTMEDFVKEFGMKDCLWAVARAWENVPETVLKHTWQILWPDLMHEVNAHFENGIPEMYETYKQQLITQIRQQTKNFKNAIPGGLLFGDLEQWIEEDETQEEAIIGNSHVSAPVQNVNKEDTGGKGNNGSEMELVKSFENKSIDDCIHLTNELMTGLEQHSFVTDNVIMCLYKIKTTLISQKYKQIMEASGDSLENELLENEKVSDDIVTSSLESSSICIQEVSVLFIYINSNYGAYYFKQY